MIKIKEGGPRKNMSQDTIDRFVHELLLVADPKRRQEIVDEIFDRIKTENTEAYLKAHPELNKQKENILKNNFGLSLRESRIADYMTEKYGDNPDDWDFDNTPIDQFTDEELDEFEAPGIGSGIFDANGEEYDGDPDDIDALEAWQDTHPAPGMGDEFDDIDDMIENPEFDPEDADLNDIGFDEFDTPAHRGTLMDANGEVYDGDPDDDEAIARWQDSHVPPDMDFDDDDDDDIDDMIENPEFDPEDADFNDVDFEE